MSRQPGLAGQTTDQLMLNKESKRHDILVNSIERITRDFPDLLYQRRIFLKLTNFIEILTGSMRGMTLICLRRFYVAVGSNPDGEVL